MLRCTVAHSRVGSWEAREKNKAKTRQTRLARVRLARASEERSPDRRTKTDTRINSLLTLDRPARSFRGLAPQNSKYLCIPHRCIFEFDVPKTGFVFCLEESVSSSQ